jgi:hypothetical protein
LAYLKQNVLIPTDLVKKNEQEENKPSNASMITQTQYSELVDLIATMKDDQIELREKLVSTQEQVALLSEALMKPAGYVGQEPNQ